MRAGRLPEARSFLGRAFAIGEQGLGADHPETGESLYYLGLPPQAKGNDEGTRLRFERALEISERRLGENHPIRRQIGEALVQLAAAQRP